MKCFSCCKVTGMYLTVYTWNYSLALLQLCPENIAHPDSVPISPLPEILMRRAWFLRHHTVLETKEGLGLLLRIHF